MTGKPKLLVLELWGLGDLMIATPFLRAAAEKYHITLLAKPLALDLRDLFWPSVQVLPFTAPWTPFRGKYHLWRWPWGELQQLVRHLRAKKFDYGLSARWDPRDHLLLRLSGAHERWGFPRLASDPLLTRALPCPSANAHVREYWRTAAEAFGLKISGPEDFNHSRPDSRAVVQIHTGARLPARIWPLENYLTLANRLRGKHIAVEIICDADQLNWWISHGETAICPRSIKELHGIIRQAGVFIGNCSGPGHMAAVCHVPTFTIFGPSLPEWFAPVSPVAEIFVGKACPYKPCADDCRFSQPICLTGVTVDEVWPRIDRFVGKNLCASRMAPQ